MNLLVLLYFSVRNIQRSLLVNSEIFSQLSECKDSIKNEKAMLKLEIVKLQEEILDLEDQLVKLNDKINFNNEESLRTVARYENILSSYSKKSEESSLCQTDIELKVFQHMYLQYEVSTTIQRLV